MYTDSNKQEENAGTGNSQGKIKSCDVCYSGFFTLVVLPANFKFLTLSLKKVWGYSDSALFI